MDKLKIVFASPEAVPFAKTGGLADVAGALPRSLASLGADVTLIMPRYGFIPYEFLGGATQVVDSSVRIGDSLQNYKMYQIRDRKLTLDTILIENDEYFNRASLYTDPHTLKDYPDNDRRFMFFALAVMEGLKKLGVKPDIIHANDWQSALLPIYLKNRYGDDPFYSATASVFTIHNLAYQGVFPAESFKYLGLPDNLFYSIGPLEYYGKVNLMKGAIYFSDIITTVSPSYAREIQTDEEFGFGLEGVLQSRSDDLRGILNGVDYKVWSPSRDKFAPHHYNLANMSGKRANKVDLLNELDLPYRDYSLLIGMITRLVDQKGLDILAEVADDLLKLDIQLVVLGTGDTKYHELLTNLQKKYHDQVRALLKFDNTMAHWIEAASDLFLMPSQFEPCGLNQLYSLKYGTLPIVRAVGGLADSVEDFNPATGEGTGFVFKDYKGKQLLETVKRAVSLYERKRLWRKIMKNGMKKDFSWERAAQDYISAYKQAISQKGMVTKT